jgi:hypothetical protein
MALAVAISRKAFSNMSRGVNDWMSDFFIFFFRGVEVGTSIFFGKSGVTG